MQPDSRVHVFHYYRILLQYAVLNKQVSANSSAMVPGSVSHPLQSTKIPTGQTMPFPLMFQFPTTGEKATITTLFPCLQVCSLQANAIPPVQAHTDQGDTVPPITQAFCFSDSQLSLGSVVGAASLGRDIISAGRGSWIYINIYNIYICIQIFLLQRQLEIYM